jgi:cell division protein FtsB
MSPLNLRRLVNQIRPHLTLNNGVLAVAILIGTTWAWSTVEAIQKNFKLQQQVDALTQEIALQELENKSQALQNQYYQTDEYLELSARERLNKAAPGERLILLPPNTVAVNTEAPLLGGETPIGSRSNFDQWMYFLFGDKG